MKEVKHKDRTLCDSAKKQNKTSNTTKDGKSMEVRQLPVGAGWRPGYLEMQGCIQGLIPHGNSKILWS